MLGLELRLGLPRLRLGELDERPNAGSVLSNVHAGDPKLLGGATETAQTVLGLRSGRCVVNGATVRTVEGVRGVVLGRHDLCSWVATTQTSSVVRTSWSGSSSVILVAPAALGRPP